MADDSQTVKDSQGDRFRRELERLAWEWLAENGDPFDGADYSTSGNPWLALAEQAFREALLDHRIDNYESKPPERLRGVVAPLDEFSDLMRWRIAEQALAHEPPPRTWMVVDNIAELPSRGWYEWHWHRGLDPEGRRPALPSHVRRFVIERDGLVCGLCGGDVEPDDVHLDHIVPRSKGGPDTADNLQVAHSRCNIRKGARV